ncbi:MAG: BLUF domain-containing protein [Gammaproteobacteria bacterium]|nr:BLUF domain-containing protein [Gammaproteobacteria bacterium]
MFELLYASTAIIKFKRDNLFQLLAAARSKNKRLDITGMLIYSNGYFAQLLEGEEAAVRKLYETICNDHRHKNIKKFYEGPIDKRFFTEWTMGFRVLEGNGDLNQIPGFENLKVGEQLIDTIVQDPSKGRELFICMREFLMSDPEGDRL